MASTSRILGNAPEASPTRVSATKIGENKHGVMRNGIRKALAGEHGGADLGDHRPQPPDIDVGREQFERVIEPGARLQQQRQIEGEDSDVLGARPPPEANRPDAAAAVLSSVTLSIGTRPRYSMRWATSAAVGAEIEPLTSSPPWVSARYRKLGTASTRRS